MESRINWTNKQWAKHFGVTTQKVTYIRRAINDNYTATVVLNKRTNMHAVAVYKYNISPSGFKRPILQCVSHREYDNANDAVKYANEEFLPNLHLSDVSAMALNVPINAIQMLSIKER